MSTIEIYQGVDREHRWRLKSSNGNILADCAEGYKKRPSLIKALKRIIRDISGGKVKVRITGKHADPVAMQAAKEKIERALSCHAKSRK